jgi:hypothetical protein
MDGSEVQPLDIRVSDSLRLDDDDLVRLRRSSEDHFVERKSFGDWKKDAARTTVAFANSLPIGQPGFFFIGVKDNGDVERTHHDLDKIQKTLADELKLVYPRIPYVAKALSEDGCQYLVVIIHGSEGRPHFAAPSYIREGSQSKEASEQQYELLIAERQSKVREIRKYLNKVIFVQQGASSAGRTLRAEGTWTLLDCNAFYVTVCLSNDSQTRRSFPIERISICIDHKRNTLQLEIAAID